MNVLDEQYTKIPFCGVKKMRKLCNSRTRENNETKRSARILVASRFFTVLIIVFVAVQWMGVSFLSAEQFMACFGATLVLPETYWCNDRFI